MFILIDNLLKSKDNEIISIAIEICEVLIKIISIPSELE